MGVGRCDRRVRRRHGRGCSLGATRAALGGGAALFGTASAIGFAFTAALTKAVGNYFAQDWVSIFKHPQTYGLALFGVASVYLAQNAYHAGPIVASQSSIVLVDPLVSIIIGISLFGDNLRTSGAWGPLEAFSLLVMFVGAFSLVQSPLVRGIKGDRRRSMPRCPGRTSPRTGPASRSRRRLSGPDVSAAPDR